MTRDEDEARADFGERYAIPRGDVSVRIEEGVIGASWGTNGYTTVGQADALAERLELGPGHRLLDVGTGRGWPGLYIAKRMGCDVVGTDLPIEPIVSARRRAAEEEIAERVAFAVASGGDLPFRPGSFDAIVHADVLC